MPKLDGTGPLGRGPLTGRGRGLCVDGLRQLYKNTSRSTKLMSLIIPAVTTVVLDARKPNGITRQLYYAVRDRITGASRRQSLSGSWMNSLEEKNSN